MFLQTFGPNPAGRDFAIGDLHGMYDLLFKTLESVNFDFEADRCFSVGDLIDRGPKSPDCLSLIHEPWFHPVCGNHEDTLRTIARNPESSAILADWVLNGGQWHLKVSTETMLEFANWVDSLPYLILVEQHDGTRVALCHAEYPLHQWAPERIAKDPELTRLLMWSRTKVQTGNTDQVTGVDHIICGHTIVDEPLTLGNSHFIDTGAFASNTLTLFPLSDLNKINT
ncbi:metallophosphoesterase [Endozoicomonas arenosclerae]|uniref:metallophosphoesterase n=1 Tax=Endozoicomonas arenosclerae TaxID=1633495 RepID=UPI0007835B15|nr:metallophosphoesterase [Endozoicomonas arenosclerae]